MREMMQGNNIDRYLSMTSHNQPDVRRPAISEHEGGEGPLGDCTKEGETVHKYRGGGAGPNRVGVGPTVHDSEAQVTRAWNRIVYAAETAVATTPNDHELVTFIEGLGSYGTDSGGRGGGGVDPFLSLGRESSSQGGGYTSSSKRYRPIEDTPRTKHPPAMNYSVDVNGGSQKPLAFSNPLFICGEPHRNLVGRGESSRPPHSSPAAAPGSEYNIQKSVSMNSMVDHTRPPPPGVSVFDGGRLSPLPLPAAVRTVPDQDNVGQTAGPPSTSFVVVGTGGCPLRFYGSRSNESLPVQSNSGTVYSPETPLAEPASASTNHNYASSDVQPTFCASLSRSVEFPLPLEPTNRYGM